mmetsp:Transcript_31788/g.69496  ORF Transcript_31788/g.69496 Transcript_31788/m.69496 type:complete len:184 (-) Transcript_31788:133-684(-)
MALRMQGPFMALLVAITFSCHAAGSSSLRLLQHHSVASKVTGDHVVKAVDNKDRIRQIPFQFMWLNQTSHFENGEEVFVATVGFVYNLNGYGLPTKIDLPEVGQTVQEGTPVGLVETNKGMFSFKSPVTGRVSKVNDDLLKDLSYLSQAADENTWLYEAVLASRHDIDLPIINLVKEDVRVSK